MDLERSIPRIRESPRSITVVPVPIPCSLSFSGGGVTLTQDASLFRCFTGAGRTCSKWRWRCYWSVHPIIGMNGTGSEVDWEWREDQWQWFLGGDCDRRLGRNWGI